jgi:hypothetical protein
VQLEDTVVPLLARPLDIAMLVGHVFNRTKVEHPIERDRSHAV